MPRAISADQMRRLKRDEQNRYQSRYSVPMQPVISDYADVQRLRPVPSLHALEQVGGPELDEPLSLPDRQVWSSRINDLLG
ncbi:hypothetical protein [Devosia salina]|uniref:Uncharacterized protein n=1 Tax=Devosia salina TaxID=2860336 RepID=A0ABX8WGS0_9HYPH|nr:hypothetical protein [Devosia salina]QYO77938.1 hypothetical protein K1X15_05055 [Devosia salina]